MHQLRSVISYPLLHSSRGLSDTTRTMQNIISPSALRFAVLCKLYEQNSLYSPFAKQPVYPHAQPDLTLSQISHSGLRKISHLTLSPISHSVRQSNSTLSFEPSLVIKGGGGGGGFNPDFWEKTI